MTWSRVDVGKIFQTAVIYYDQWMNRHYLHCIKEAVKYHIMVNAHEAVRLLDCASLSQYDRAMNQLVAQSSRLSRIPSKHVTILPFTRLMGGPWITHRGY